MTKNELPSRLKTRKERLIKIAKWLWFNEPNIVARMVCSDEVYEEKFPKRFKRMKIFDKHNANWDVMQDKLKQDLKKYEEATPCQN